MCIFSCKKSTAYLMFRLSPQIIHHLSNCGKLFLLASPKNPWLLEIGVFFPPASLPNILQPRYKHSNFAKRLHWIYIAGLNLVLRMPRLPSAFAYKKDNPKKWIKLFKKFPSLVCIPSMKQLKQFYIFVLHTLHFLRKKLATSKTYFINYRGMCF